MSRKTQAAVDQALRSLEAGRKVSAFRSLKRLAEAGETSAFHMLGFMYDVGEGTKRSKKNAMRWYLCGYKSGDSTSASNIATMYRDAGDAKAEFDWYSRAALMGDGDAMLEVGIRYLSGKGVRKSVLRAIVCFKAVGKAPNTSEAARDMAVQLIHACPK